MATTAVPGISGTNNFHQLKNQNQMRDYKKYKSTSNTLIFECLAFYLKGSTLIVH